MKKKCLICKTTINSGKSLVCNRRTKEIEKIKETIFKYDIEKYNFYWISNFNK